MKIFRMIQVKSAAERQRPPPVEKKERFSQADALAIRLNSKIKRII